LAFEFETLILDDEQESTEEWCRERGLKMQIVMERNVRYRKPNVGFLDAPMKLVRVYNMTHEQKEDWLHASQLTPERTQSYGRGR
jgi:hypothetical protein